MAGLLGANGHCGEAGGGAEEVWGALPLKSRLSFHQDLLAVGAGYAYGGGDEGRHGGGLGRRV